MPASASVPGPGPGLTRVSSGHGRPGDVLTLSAVTRSRSVKGVCALFLARVRPCANPLGPSKSTVRFRPRGVVLVSSHQPAGSTHHHPEAQCNALSFCHFLRAAYCPPATAGPGGEAEGPLPTHKADRIDADVPGFNDFQSDGRPTPRSDS